MDWYFRVAHFRLFLGFAIVFSFYSTTLDGVFRGGISANCNHDAANTNISSCVRNGGETQIEFAPI
jgi:hypothetical protein